MSALRAISLVVISAGTAMAQFSPALLQNVSYWEPGKSEVDFYAADFARDATRVSAELLMTVTPGFVDPLSLAPLEQQRATECRPMMRMKYAVTVPRGLLLEQRSADLLWRMDPPSLVRLSFVGTDGIGNISRIVRPQPALNGTTWLFSDESYLGLTERPPLQSPKGISVFYDELPLRVRTIDFAKPKDQFEIQLAGTVAEGKVENLEFKPAKISYQKNERQIEIQLQHNGGTDHFVLDADFPFLLREWQMAGGNSWKMKNSLRADYRKYDKPGDRERALKDPMLRHPD